MFTSRPARSALSRSTAGTILALSVAVAVVPGARLAAPASALASSAVGESPEQIASDAAVSSGQPVVVNADESSVREVVAEPDGSFAETDDSQPVRMQDATSAWKNLDSTLQVAGGAVIPKVGLGTLVISDGGAPGSAIATYSRDGMSYSIMSPWALPTPRLTGSDATFANVLPGVDLVVQADPEGFSHNWVVKNAQAASNPQLLDLSLPVSTSGLTPVAADHGTSYTDSHGVQRLWSAAPIMWDSAADPSASTTSAVGDGPDAGDTVAPVKTSISPTRLQLMPASSMLSDGATVFPVVIDPPLTYTSSRNSWTTVWSNYPSTSFWKTSHSLGAGYEGYQQNKIVRSFFHFDTTRYENTKVLYSKMTVTQIWDASCSSRETDLYRTAAITSSTTWSHQPARYGEQDSSNSTAGCNGGTGSIGFDTTSGVTTVAGSADASVTFMIRAKDETDAIAWKQYDNDAKLEVHYVNKPTPPSGVGLTTSTSTKPTCSTNSAAPTVVNKTSVTLRATVHAPDSNESMHAVFQRQNTTTVTNSSALTAGDQGTYTWGGLTNGTKYAFRAQSEVYWSAVSGQYSAGTLLSTTTPSGSGWCYFKIDTSAPDLPNVDLGTAFTECDASGATSCPSQGMVGQRGSITVSDSSTDTKSFDVIINGGAPTNVSDAGGGPITVSILPSDVMNTLTVKVYDSAGNTSATTTYFKVNPRTATASWNFDGSDATALTAAVGVAADSHGRLANGLNFSGSGAAITTNAPTTAGTFSVSAWVRIDADTPTTLFAAITSGGNALSVNYDPAGHDWFLQEGANTPLRSSAIALAHVWTQLAVTYDAPTAKATFYVNGRIVGTQTGTISTNGGGWSFGAGNNAGQPSSPLTGELDAIEIDNYLRAAGEINVLADPVDPATNNPALAYGSQWELADSSDNVGSNTLSIANLTAPAFVPADSGTSQQAINLPGTGGTGGQTVTASRPAVDANGSFTVSAWVNLTDESQPAVVAQQAGAAGPNWTLGFVPNSDPTQGGAWTFSRTESDSAPGGAITDTIQDFVAPDSGDWTYVVGVYDALNDQINIYVNGQAAVDQNSYQTTPTPFTAPWQARGQISLGQGTLANGTTAPTAGLLTDVEVEVGAANLPEATDAYASSWYMNEGAGA